MCNFDQAVVIALGSNQSFNGQGPAELLQTVLADLAENGIDVAACSRFYETPCFPAGAGPDYVNAAALLETDLSPQDLLEVLHKVEAGLGRERRTRWAARTVDIDLIAHGQRVLPSTKDFLQWYGLPLDQQSQTAPDQLILPHPRMHERSFVLVPMMDVAADWTHPVLRRTVREMCENLPVVEKTEVKPI